MSGPCPPAISDIDPVGARNFTLFRRKPRGHELVNGSMAVSRAVLHGSFSWSSRTGPEGRLILKFPLGWQHSLCPVQSWYKTQQARLLGQRPSTTFDTIEHHRSLEGPFFHEFLLIPVLDGSGYRVERTGVGSDADAISPTGCEANDLIEWFPAHKFQPLIDSGQSHLISRFTLDSELDILNVLAGCYSIFQEKQTRGYTLQRYNCYFFCCTILAVLVRRVADWEHIITEALWPSVLNATLERLLRLSEHPASDETRRHVLLRLFHGLHPANQQPTRSLVDALQKVLGSEDGVRDHFNSALASMIWGSDHHLSMSQYLASYVNAAILEACAKDAVCDQVLNVKERNPVDDALVISSKGFNSLYAPGDIAATAAHSAHIFQDVLPALEREHGVSRGARLIFSIGGVIIGLAHAFQPSNFTHTEKGFTLPQRISMGLKRGRLMSRCALVGLDPFSLEDESLVYTLDIPGTHATLDQLEKKGPLIASEVALTLESGFIGFSEDPDDTRREEWAETLVGSCLYEILVEEAAKALALRGPSVQVIQQNQGQNTGNRMNMVEFQAHIEGHIQRYASRVDRYQLSVARVIHRDVRDAISKVWKAMPEGFGPRSGSQVS